MQSKELKKEKLGKDQTFEENYQGLNILKMRIWVPKFGGNRRLVLDNAHKSKYSVHPGSTKHINN